MRPLGCAIYLTPSLSPLARLLLAPLRARARARAQHHGIVQSTAGTSYYVRVLSTLDRSKLVANASVALHRHSHALVEVLPPEADSSIQAMQMTEKPVRASAARARTLARHRARPLLVCLVPPAPPHRLPPSPALAPLLAARM